MILVLVLIMFCGICEIASQQNKCKCVREDFQSQNCKVGAFQDRTFDIELPLDTPGQCIDKPYDGLYWKVDTSCKKLFGYKDKGCTGTPIVEDKAEQCMVWREAQSVFYGASKKWKCSEIPEPPKSDDLCRCYFMTYDDAACTAGGKSSTGRGDSLPLMDAEKTCLQDEGFWYKVTNDCKKLERYVDKDCTPGFELAFSGTASSVNTKVDGSCFRWSFSKYAKLVCDTVPGPRPSPPDKVCKCQKWSYPSGDCSGANIPQGNATLFPGEIECQRSFYPIDGIARFAHYIAQPGCKALSYYRSAACRDDEKTAVTPDKCIVDGDNGSYKISCKEMPAPKPVIIPDKPTAVCNCKRRTVYSEDGCKGRNYTGKFNIFLQPNIAPIPLQCYKLTAGTWGTFNAECNKFTTYENDFNTANCRDDMVLSTIVMNTCWEKRIVIDCSKENVVYAANGDPPCPLQPEDNFSFEFKQACNNSNVGDSCPFTCKSYWQPYPKGQIECVENPGQKFSKWDYSKASCTKEAPPTPPAPDNAERCHCFDIIFESQNGRFGARDCKGKNDTVRYGYDAAYPIARPGYCVQHTKNRFVRYGVDKNGKCASISEYSAEDCESTSHFASSHVDRCEFGDKKLMCVTYPAKPPTPTGKQCKCSLQLFKSTSCSDSPNKTIGMSDIANDAELCVDAVEWREWDKTYYRAPAGCGSITQYPSSACAKWEEKSFSSGSCQSFTSSWFNSSFPRLGNYALPKDIKAFKIDCAEENVPPPPPQPSDLCSCLLIKYEDGNCTQKEYSVPWKLYPGVCRAGWRNWLKRAQYAAKVTGTAQDKCANFKMFSIDPSEMCNERGKVLELQNNNASCSAINGAWWKVKCSDSAVRKTSDGKLGCLEAPKEANGMLGGEITEDCTNKLPGETCAFECHFGFALSGAITCLDNNGKHEWSSTAKCRAQEFCDCSFTESQGHMCPTKQSTSTNLWPDECVEVKFSSSGLTKKVKIEQNCKSIYEFPKDDKTCYRFQRGLGKLTNGTCMNDDTSSVSFQCKEAEATCAARIKSGGTVPPECEPVRCKCYWVNNCDDGENNTATVPWEWWPIMTPGQCSGPVGLASMKWQVNDQCKNFAHWTRTRDCAGRYVESRRMSWCSGHRQLWCDKLPAEAPKMDKQCVCKTSYYSSTSCSGSPINTTVDWQELKINDEYCFRGPRGADMWGTNKLFKATAGCNLEMYPTHACAPWEKTPITPDKCFTARGVGVKVSCRTEDIPPVPTNIPFPPTNAKDLDICECVEKFYATPDCSGEPFESAGTPTPVNQCFTNTILGEDTEVLNSFDRRTVYTKADETCSNINYYVTYWNFPDPKCKEDNLFTAAKNGKCINIPDTKLYIKVDCTKKKVRLETDGEPPCATEPTIDGGGKADTSCIGLAVGSECKYSCPENKFPARNNNVLKCEAVDNQYWGRWTEVDCVPNDYCACTFWSSSTQPECHTHEENPTKLDLYPGVCEVGLRTSLKANDDCTQVGAYQGPQCRANETVNMLDVNTCYTTNKRTGHLMIQCRPRKFKNEHGCPDLMMMCDGVCIDVSNTDNHCGACNYKCDPTHACGDGVCRHQCDCRYQMFLDDKCSNDPLIDAPVLLHHGGCLDFQADLSVYAEKRCKEVHLFNHWDCVPPAALIIPTGKCVANKGNTLWFKYICEAPDIYDLRASSCVMPTFMDCGIDFNSTPCQLMPKWAKCLVNKGCINQLAAACYGIFHKFRNSCGGSLPAECDSDEVVIDRDVCSSFEYGQCSKELFNDKPDADDCYLMEADAICAKTEKCADIFADTCHTGGPFQKTCPAAFKQNC